MKPIWKDGKLTVELHKPDEDVLRKALTIGEALDAMNQATGAPLVAAVNAILFPKQPNDEPQK